MIKEKIDIFIEKAKLVHGDKYNYNQVSYINNYTKVIIICPIHGEFYQTPANHLHNHGCYKCRNNLISDKKKLPYENFLKRAIVIHGEKYDYSNISYTDTRNKISIICKRHGIFEQTPNAHLNGNGCPNCQIEKFISGRSNTTKKFIEKARDIHGNKYDYSKIEYVNNRIKVTITCPEHGDFEQQPKNHLSNKQGCPKCNFSKGELTIKEILDRKNIKYIPQYKLPYYRYEYDFYLPDHNVLIEFHGGQHYFPVKHFGGKDEFNKIQERDMFKKALAKEYKIPLLEFNYKQLKYLSKEHFEQLILNSIIK